MKHLLYTPLISSILIISACGGGGSNTSNNTPNPPENSSPDLILTSTNLTVSYGEDVVLDASATADADGDSLTFSWSGDVNVESPSASSTSVLGLGVGSYRFTVTVSDGTNQVSENIDVTVTGPEIIETTKLVTGSISAPTFAYYDLDTATILTLSEDEAAISDDWDIAFRRTEVFLNSQASSPVSLHFLNNVDEFYDDTGGAIIDRFVNATASTELAAFESISTDLANDATFYTDELENIISGFYTYDPITHTAPANSDAYFIVSSDNALTKFHVTEINQDGFGLTSITFGTQYQADGESFFAEESAFAIDASTCTTQLYIDFDSNTLVAADDNWDIQIPCSDGLADYEINLAADALALSGDYADLAGIDDENFPFYDWSENQAQLLAITEHGDARSNYGWGEYGVNGGHVLWPNFATYIIQTATARYKFQITSYYDADTGASGSYSIRHQLVLSD